MPLTFAPVTPDVNFTEDHSPRVLSAGFGDGYSQEVIDGLNADPESWSFNWTNITKTQADYINGFLKARGGAESFYYTPPNETTARLFKCKKWNKVTVSSIVYNVSATFVQAFDL